MRTEPLVLDPTHPSTANLFTRPDLQRLAAGSVLFREGDRPAGVYILHAGEVSLSSLVNGRIAPFRTAYAGEILGLMAVISNDVHRASATATTLCEVGFIESAEFRTLIDRTPSIWFSVLRQLSQDLNASYDVIRERFERGRC